MFKSIRQDELLAVCGWSFVQQMCSEALFVLSGDLAEHFYTCNNGELLLSEVEAM